MSTIHIWKNGVTIGSEQTSSDTTATNQNVQSICVNPLLIPVEEGDVIDAAFYSASGVNNGIQRSFSTQMTVEVVK